MYQYARQQLKQMYAIQYTVHLIRYVILPKKQPLLFSQTNFAEVVPL